MSRWGHGRLAILLLAAPACTEPPAPLRVALNPWPGYEALFLADSQGYYAAEGVEVRLVEFASLSDARRAFERGQVDGIATSMVEVLQAREVPSQDATIVRVFDYSSGGDQIIAHAPCPTVWSLRGQKVGVEFASLGVFVLARALERAGLTLRDVTLVSGDQLTLKQRFAEGALGAIVTYPPTSVGALQLPGAKVIFSSKEIPGEVIDVLAFERKVLDQRAEDVRRLLRAYDRASEFAQRQPEIAIPIMAARERLSPAEFAAALNGEVTLVPAADQARYLGPEGSIQQVLDAADRVLTTGQLDGPDRRRGAFTGAFIESSRK